MQKDHSSTNNDGKEHSPDTFFGNYQKKLKHLLPKHLPSRPSSFREYLSSLFKPPNAVSVKRFDIYSHSGDTVNYEYARSRSFIATAFPPITVGELAGREVDHISVSDIFPQFTHYGKSEYHCELCVPYQQWAKSNCLKHSPLKSKHVEVDDIINGTAILRFS